MFLPGAKSLRTPHRIECVRVRAWEESTEGRENGIGYAVFCGVLVRGHIVDTDLAVDKGCCP
eukprot:9002184-Alexandrium_andersonii.AAC.1